jgi:hypothetical protein
MEQMTDESSSPLRARANRITARVFRGDLGERVAQLEAEVHECRRLSLRLAELTDIVQELLIPLAQSDPAKVEEILRRYGDELGT